MMSAPFVWTFVLFAAGILAGMHLQIPSSVLFGSSVVAGISLRCRRFWPGFAAQVCFLFLLGQQFTQLHQQAYEDNELRRWVRFHEQEMVPLEGVLVRTPEMAADYFVLHLRTSLVAGQRTTGVVRLSVSGNLREMLTAGDRLETFARLRLPKNFRVEGGFDHERYLRKEGVHVLGSVKNPLLLRRIGREKSIRSFVSTIRLRMILRIQEQFVPTDSALLRALWLDDRSALPLETERTLINAGVFHVIAISGFHVAVLIAIGFVILKRIVRYRIAILCLSTLLLMYFLLLEGRSSITRSLITFYLFAFAAYRCERIPWGNLFFASAFGQLVWNPLELFDSGYHLTYLSTGAILFVAAPVCKWIHLPRRLYQSVLDFVIVSLSIQFVLAPYQAFVFHRIPFASVLANPVAVPVSSVLIAAGSLVLMLNGQVCVLTMLIHLLLNVLGATSSLFGEFWLAVVSSPPAWIVVCFYGALAAAFLYKSGKGRWLCSVVCLGCFLVILHPFEKKRGEYFRLHVIDVGQGDAILLEYPDGTCDLIDGGGFWKEEALDVGEAVLLPYLSHLNIRGLHRVFLTHAHADHMNGLITLLNYVPAKELYVTRQPLAELGYQRFVTRIPLVPRGIHRGTEFQQGGVRIRVLAPEDSNHTLRVRNDDSLVLLVECEGKRILLAGDAETPTEEKLLQDQNLRADVVKVPHHGSRTSSSEEFVERLSVKTALISVGRNNWFGHPDPSVLQRYRSRHAMIYRTDQLGTLTVTLSKEGATVDSYVWSH